jgi:acetolactate synthase-1/2/3 large subunit
VNGAHALIQTLVASGVGVCFANPGTSEMHFVAAVDDVPDLRIVLALFEGVATGAADGYARMTDRPAATLLHLGPGMANGLANLHNARRARVPVVNIVGDHATYHKHFDAPLNSDIEPAAGTVSGWVQRPTRPADIGRAAAAAVAASLGAPPVVATLILPADVSWGDGAAAATPIRPTAPATVDDGVIDSVAKVLTSGRCCLLLAGGRAARAAPLRELSRIAKATGARTLLETSTARLERGGGIPVPDRLAYRADQAAAQLAGVDHLILVDAKSPAAYFAYPDKASDFVPAGCTVHVLTSPGDDTNTALAHLADLVAADIEPTGAPLGRAERPTGALTPTTIGDAISALIPEGAVVTDEGVSSGRFVQAPSSGAPRHDWLGTTGGAIGMGLPLAVGASIAVGDRNVIAVQADGSAMYTIQALWTMARENLDICVIILNNRRYNILKGELKQVGATGGRKALDMLDLSRPDLDFVAISTGLGVAAERATTAEGFTAALERALTTNGPHLIQADI